MSKVKLYPIWIRLWHWFNALLFFILIVSGINLHYADNKSLYLSFSVSMLSHNIAGVLLSCIYLYYFIMSIISGNIKQYIPKLKGIFRRLRKQAKYYLLGIFNKDAKPYHSTVKQKFNPLQQISYLGVMAFLMPLIIVTGWFMLFPELAPTEIFGMGGVWPMAIVHIIIGFFLSLFMFGHIYLATTGTTVGEYLKCMISGWHLSEEHEEEQDDDEDSELTGIFAEPKKGGIFPVIFYNPVTITGTLLALITFICIVFLSAFEYFSENSSPYTGIVSFVVLPSFLVFNLFLVAIGIFKENRRVIAQEIPEERELPIINLNNPKHQIATLAFIVGTFTFVIFSVYGSFKAYEYTDSDVFCGTVCHKVLEPQYITYHDSPHARVGCVKCHIGQDKGWLVKSKLSGLYQIYAVMFNKYPKPLPTPEYSLRPTPQICEQCHWPRQFYHENKISYDFFTSDEKNSEYKLTMAVKAGGGNIDLGHNSGIHAVMNLNNEITYLAVDRERMDIPWVKSKSLITGKETIFKKIDAKISDDLLKPENLRRMDCIDCHNRPAHIFNQPNKQVNSYLSAGLIDKNLPYIKSISIQAMESYVTSKKTAINDINNFIYGFYKSSYPEVAKSKSASINQAVDQLNKLYQRNYFPDMQANWRSFPNNIGHMYSPGCFRCHDGLHVSNEGKVISTDCNVCHTIVYQKAPDKSEEESTTGLLFNHPGGLDKFVNDKLCYKCHGAYPNKKNYQ